MKTASIFKTSDGNKTVWNFGDYSENPSPNQNSTGYKSKSMAISGCRFSNEYTHYIARPNCPMSLLYFPITFDEISKLIETMLKSENVFNYFSCRCEVKKPSRTITAEKEKARRILNNSIRVLEKSMKNVSNSMLRRLRKKYFGQSEKLHEMINECYDKTLEGEK